MAKSLLLAAIAGIALMGCDTVTTGAATDASEVDVVDRLDIAPPGARPGSCWSKAVKPAVIETVTEQVLVQPAETLDSGEVTRPAVYRTETRQKIVDAREESIFETICAADLTPPFIASVQRALSARGFYKGPVTSQMDQRTRTAIRAYQEPQGIASGVLSRLAAQRMGLVVVEQTEES